MYFLFLQKSAQTISQLQKKLDEYQKRLKFLDEKGVQIKPAHKMRDKVQVNLTLRFCNWLFADAAITVQLIKKWQLQDR